MKTPTLVCPGFKSGQLTVIWRSTKRTCNNARMWVCRCGCEKFTHVPTDRLSGKTTRSCGCSTGLLISKKLTRHGKYGSPEYRVWAGMLTRCRNPKDPTYQRYGLRGISVCERWLKFENFVQDMGERPSDIHSIDRIDNNGNYEPGNCRWATKREQGSNKRNNRLIEINGVSKTLSQWVRITGRDRGNLIARLNRMSPKDAIFGSFKNNT